MRLPIHAALIPALIVGSPSHLNAQAKGDRTESPYFFVKSEDPATDQLPLKSTSAEVDIAGVIARVKVTQIYKNEGKHALEAIYVFPGSTRSAVHALTMTIGDRIIHAQIKEKEQARMEYEQAKQEGRSATLLEQQRPNVFQMNVANLLPGDEIKVEMEYTELLEPSEGTYQFVYPTVVGPRYSGIPGTPSSTGEKWVASPYTPAGVAPTTTFDLTLRLSAGMPIQRMTCGTHRTHIEQATKDVAELKLDSSESKGGNRDFIFSYQLAGGAVQSGLLLHRGKGENFFLLMAQPPKRVTPAQMPPREYIFIMDVSGSQMGFPLEISKELMKEMIQGLRPQDRFNVMVFEGSSALWSPESQPASPGNLKGALEFIHAQYGGGGTELGAAMKRALTLPRIPGMSRSFVVSTDGYIASDASLFDLIRTHLGDANLFTFGTGPSVNRHLIEGMAHIGQGETFVLTDPSQAKAEADRFRAYASTPVLTQVKLKADGFQTYDVEPLQLPDVMAERPVVAFGKWKGETKGTLTVSGFGGGGAWAQSFDVSGVRVDESSPALRQLWARKRIQMISDYAQFGMTEERKKEITQLGLAYNLITPFTSFLAVDSKVRNPKGESTTVQQPLPMPQGVSNAAIRGSMASGSTLNLAPGVVGSGYSGATTPTISGSATVTVTTAVCCAASDLGGDVALAALPRRSKMKIAPQQPLESRSLHLGQLQADRPDVPLMRVNSLLELKLNELQKAGLLHRMPAHFILRLQIDASGSVTSVVFDRECGKAGKLLQSQMLGWRLEAWAVPGTTTLTLPIRVSK